MADESILRRTNQLEDMKKLTSALTLDYEKELTNIN